MFLELSVFVVDFVLAGRGGPASDLADFLSMKLIASKI